MSRILIRALLLSLSAATVAACAGAEAEPRTGASPATTTGNPTLVESCEAFFARAATCTDDYIPALVDVRIDLDKPAGIAAAAQTEGRAAIVVQAKAEWANDSQPAAISAACAQMTQTLAGEQAEAMQAAAAACVAAADCATFSTCAAELQRDRIAAQ